MCFEDCLGIATPRQAKMARLAQRVWAQCVGKPRLRLKKRIDVGVKKRKHMEGDRPCGSFSMASTEASFLRKRRKAVAEASVLHKPKVEVPTSIPGWSECHTKELHFQNDKLQKSRVQASTEGTLLQSEDSAAVQADAKMVRSNLIQSQRARGRK